MRIRARATCLPEVVAPRVVLGGGAGLHARAPFDQTFPPPCIVKIEKSLPVFVTAVE